MNKFSPDKPKPAEQNPLEKIQELEQKNNDLKERLVDAITDPVTGLERRNGLFQDINVEFTEMLDLQIREEIEELSGPELVKILNELIINERIKRMPLSVAMCDVAYLSLANKSGLRGGDELLKGIGDAARAIGSPQVKLREDLTEKEKKPLIKFFRHGGDEITALVREWPNEAQAKLNKFSQEVESITGIKDLEANNLLPHIDYGVAHITEAITALKNIIEANLEQTEIPPGSRLKTLENLWLEIAEIKAKVNKTTDRIILLAQLKTTQPELYDQVIAYLRKGAQNITDAKLTDLIKQAKNKISGDKWEKIISEFVIQEMKDENALNPRNQIILESIL